MLSIKWSDASPENSRVIALAMGDGMTDKLLIIRVVFLSLFWVSEKEL